MATDATMPITEPIRAIQRRLDRDKAKTGKKPPRRPRIEEINPDMPRVVAETYLQSGSKRKTVLLTGLAEDTVNSILERNPEALTDARKRLGNKALKASELYLDQALSTVSKAQGTSAAIGAKVLGQMALEQHDLMPATTQINVAILGQATGRLEEIQTQLDALIASRAKPVEPTLPVVDATLLESSQADNNHVSNAMLGDKSIELNELGK